jgi:hypothetical protein
MKYSVHRSGSSVKITVDGVGSKQTELLKEFSECAEGRCSCPTAQYEKVESMQVTPGEDQLSITLKPKPGKIIDQDDIKKCLEHTTRKVGEDQS